MAPRYKLSGKYVTKVFVVFMTLFFMNWLVSESYDNILLMARNGQPGFHDNESADDTNLCETAALRDGDYAHRKCSDRGNDLIVGGYTGVYDADHDEITFGDVSVYGPVFNWSTQLRYTVDSVITNQMLAPKWQKNSLRWVSTRDEPLKHYFLSVIAFVRIHDDGHSKWSVAELKQWMHYLFWAGVEHIFICNKYVKYRDNVKAHLYPYILLNLVTVVPWNFDATPTANRISCYNHFRSRGAKKSLWQMTLNIDEYPFCSEDQTEGFLRNSLKKLVESPDYFSVSNIRVQSYAVVGKPDTKQDLLIGKLSRTTVLSLSGQSKSLYRPALVIQNDEKFVHIKYGTQIRASAADIRLLCYLGYLPVNKTDVSIETRPFNVVKNYIAPSIRRSLITFNDSAALSSKTGPYV